MCNREYFEKLGDFKCFEDLKSEETLRIDGVMVKVDYASEADGRITPNELGNYLDRGRVKEPNRKLVWLHLLVEGDDVAIHYGYEPEQFERIRRITGYLVGTLDRFNDAKRAEESERVKHMSADSRNYENTGLVCRRCGHPVYESDNAEYPYQCFHCDEDLFSFEVVSQDRFNDAKRAEESERVKHMSTKEELQVGKPYEIDFYDLLLEKLGSDEAIRELEDEARVEIEFGQDLRVMKSSIPGAKPLVDLIADCGAAICSGNYVEVESVHADRVKLKLETWVKPVYFDLTRAHAIKSLN